jgi:hypothetical protein
LNLHPSQIQQTLKIVLKLFLAACRARRQRHRAIRFKPREAHGLSTSIPARPAGGPGRVRTLLPRFAFQSAWLITFVLISCGKPTPTFTNLDITKWKEDRAACGDIRKNSFSAFTAQKDKLKGLSQDAIVELLGKPDQNELYKRNQKFFYYFLTPGKACGSDSIAHRLSLRFNAMGFAKEVLVE